LTLDYFNNLYLFNGTFIFVSDDPVAAGFPEHGARYILTDVSKGKVNGPTGDDVFRVVGTDEARTLLGKIAVRQCGVSVSGWSGQKGHLAVSLYAISY
jgi:hypothetical protein